ncbi:hypothetical protein TorRG33x02_207790 [Trema orientale]|uniref:Uncharacterized protein n=1 Tax=Trema orientale TaxID=63057 RepID=A0A2P5ECW8_TREOI|nr:hypothetical protein TorRG33x02_207790 [Trema orientale]
MGKKKQQKTKEISVAIAEASSTKGDETHQQAQPQTPRKRGRPRKIIETAEKSEEKAIELTEEAAHEKEQVVVGDVSTQSQSKKVKTSEEEQVLLLGQGETQKLIKEEGGSSAAMGGAKKEVLPRRKGRRKSKPRKSS